MICYYFREAFLDYFPLKAAVLIFSPQEYNGHPFQGAGKEQVEQNPLCPHDRIIFLYSGFSLKYFMKVHRQIFMPLLTHIFKERRGKKRELI